MKKEDLLNFIDGMSDIWESEQVNLYRKIASECSVPNFDGPEEFTLMALHPWEDFIAGLISQKISKVEEVHFIYTKYHYLESHFTNIFVRFEGHTCSADKSRTILNSLLDFFIEGREMSFDQSAEYTYHLPKKVLNDHTEILDFFDGLLKLYYGSPEKYLEKLKTITEKAGSYAI